MIPTIPITGTIRKANGEVWSSGQVKLQMISTIVADSSDESVFLQYQQIVTSDGSGLLPNDSHALKALGGYTHKITFPDGKSVVFVAPAEVAVLTIDEVVALGVGGIAEQTQGYRGVTTAQADWLASASVAPPTRPAFDKIYFTTGQSVWGSTDYTDGSHYTLGGGKGEDIETYDELLGTVPSGQFERALGWKVYQLEINGVAYANHTNPHKMDAVINSNWKAAFCGFLNSLIGELRFLPVSTPKLRFGIKTRPGDEVKLIISDGFKSYDRYDNRSFMVWKDQAWAIHVRRADDWAVDTIPILSEFEDYYDWDAANSHNQEYPLQSWDL